MNSAFGILIYGITPLSFFPIADYLKTEQMHNEVKTEKGWEMERWKIDTESEVI